ncbi:MAG: VanZ family protein [Roseburia sp.]
MVLDRKKQRIAAWILFILYFIVLFYFLFFAESLGRTYAEREYHYNLIPLREIKRFLRHADILGTRAVMLNIFGNIAAFVPFGFFLPVFSRRCKKFGYVLLYSFELSLLVELIQLVTKVGSFDVDDMILNTLGGICGYFVYRGVQAFRSRWRKKRTGK